jgi:hypothetical protein
MARELWVPYYDQTDATVFGDDWPVWIVARWERNGIGETRFTGETRVYWPLGVDTLARAIAQLHDVTPEHVEGDPPDPELDARDEYWMSPRDMARRLLAILKDKP